MTPFFTKGILTFVIMSCLFALGTSIMCYSCQYLKCADNYDINEYPEHQGDCDDDQYCVKYKTIVWIQNSGEIKGNKLESHVVTRSCEPKSGQKEGCIGWQNNGGVTLKCWCGTDGCNSGWSLKPSSGTTLMAFVVGVFVTLRALYH